MTAVIPDLLHPVVLAATKAKSTSSSGSSLFFVFLLVIAVAAYFLFLRPQQQKARKQRAMQSDIHEGDEVVTVGGIVGRVLEMEDDRVHLLTGHHTTVGASEHLPHRMTFVRNAIARKVEPTAPDPVTNGSGDVDDFSFEHEEAEHDEAEDAYAEDGYGEDGWSEEDLAEDEAAEDEAPDDVVADGHANGNGAAAPDDRSSGRGRGRRAQGGAKGGTSP